MRLVGCLALTLALGLAVLVEDARACSAVRSNVRLELFDCFCPGEGALETPIFSVSGTMRLSNRKAAPTLASLVVELQTRRKGKYITVATLVINEADDAFVDTCRGGFSAGPVPGRIVFRDGNSNELTFGDVKNLPIGVTELNYIATFAGPIPGLELGGRGRIRVYTTTIGAHTSGTCTVDADGDGFNDQRVKTFRFQRAVRIPALAQLVFP
jgi:hypothetical protein